MVLSFAVFIKVSQCSTRYQAEDRARFFNNVRFYFLDYSSDYYKITFIYGGYFSVNR